MYESTGPTATATATATAQPQAAASTAEPAGASTQFTSAGPKPAVAPAGAATPPPSASQQAYDLVAQATAAAGAYLCDPTAEQAVRLAYDLTIQRAPVYLGEVVDQLRLAKSGTRFRDQAAPHVPAIDGILHAARPAADDTAAANAAPKDGVMRAITTPGHGDVFAERYVYELFHAGKLTPAQLAPVRRPADRQRLGAVLGAAERDGLVPGSAITALDQPDNTAEVDGSYGGINDPLAVAAEGVLEQDLDHRRAALVQAEAAVRALDLQLAQQLHEVGGVVADGTGTAGDTCQLGAYVAAFRASNKYAEAQQRVQLARDALARSLAAHDADWAAQVADNRSPEAQHGARDALLASQTAMAASDQPWRALDWVAAHRGDPAYADARDRLQNIEDLAGSTAVTSTIAALREQLQRRGDPGSTLDAIVATLQQASDLYGKYTQFAGLAKLPELIVQSRANFVVLLAGQDSAAAREAVTAFLAIQRDASMTRKLCDALGGMFTSLVGATEIADPLAAASTVKAFYDSLAAFRAATRPELASDSAPAAEVEAWKGYAAKVKTDFFTVTRLFAVFSLVEGAGTLIADFQALSTDASPARWIETIGDAASEVGNALCLVPGLEPLGAAISMVGGLISTVAGLFVESDEQKQKDARRANERTNLVASGLVGPCGEDTAAGLVTTDAGIAAVSAARERGLSAEQVRELATTQGFLFESATAIGDVATLWSYLTGHMPLPPPGPGQHFTVWELRPGLAPTLWQFLQLYDVAAFAAIFRTEGVGASPELGLAYRRAFPAGAMQERTH